MSEDLIIPDPTKTDLTGRLLDVLGRVNFYMCKVKTHDRFMKKAIMNAKKSQPDDAGPYVGAVIAKDYRVVAEAYKVREAWPGQTPRSVRNLHLCHAEEKSIEMAGEEARGAIMYVTLEPCITRNARGRMRPSDTPCVDLIKQSGISTVIVGMLDWHNPEMRGNGLLELAYSGIRVGIYNHGLYDKLQKLIDMGKMRRKSKEREYSSLSKLWDIRRNVEKPEKPLKKPSDGNKRESNRLIKMIRKGVQEYEDSKNGN